MAGAIGTGYNPYTKYVFLKDVKQEFSIKKGETLDGEWRRDSVNFYKSPKCPPNTKCKPLVVTIPTSEIGKTIKVVNAAIPPVSSGGSKPEDNPTTGGTTTGGTTTTQDTSLFTTKNIVIGIAVLAIGYFAYTKFIKKGKGK